MMTALTPNDPEHSLISFQFPEFREETPGPRQFGLQLVAPASFEYRDHWATGPGYARGKEYRSVKHEFAELILRS